MTQPDPTPPWLLWDRQNSSAATGPPEGGRRPPWRGRLIDFMAREQPALFGWVPVMLAIGVAVYFALPREPNLALAVLLGISAGVIAWLSARRPVGRVVTSALVLVAIGFGVAKLRTEWVRAPVLERSLGVVDIHGIVERVEARPKRGARLTLRPISIEGVAGDALPFRVRIRVLKLIEGLTPGTAIRINARLAPPPPPALPGGFDFARHAWFQKIGGVGFAFQKPEIVPFVGKVPWSLRLAAGIETVRQTIAARMRAVLPGQSGAIAIALVTGERGGISEHTNEIYRDAGLFHILSISGMHMAIMAGAVFFIVRLGFAAIPALALRYPIKKWSAVIAAMAALGYLALSGGAFATVRSYIMISVMFFAVLLDRPALALRNVAVAAAIIILLFPESVLDPGFQMSFAAVLALVSVYEWLRRTGWAGAVAEFGPLRKTLVFFFGIVISTVVAGLAVAPFAAYHFHTTQHLAVLANLIAMPVSNIVIMPAALAVLVLMPFGLEWPAVIAMGLGIDVMTATADWVAGLPGAISQVPTMLPSAFLFIVLGGLWLVLWQTRWRFAGVATIAAGLALVPLGPRPDVLIGNRGKAVYVRGADGALRAVKPKRRVSFEAKRWLEADGQDVRSLTQRPAGRDTKTRANSQRRSKKQTPTTPPLRPVAKCDAVGCVASVKGLTLAVAHHPAALPDDCRSANIIVFNAPMPQDCTSPDSIVDFFDVYYGGTHALYLDDAGAISVKSVAYVRGKRPWTLSLPGREKYRARRTARIGQTRDAASSPSGGNKKEKADVKPRPTPPATFEDDTLPSQDDTFDGLVTPP